MMKKVLYGVALTLFAGVSVGSLQSCKDDVNDIATQTSYDLTKLRSQLTAEAARLDGRIDALAERHKADIDYINGLIGDLQQADVNLANKIDGAVDRLDGRIDALTNNVYDKEHIDALENYIKGQLGAMQEELTALKEFAESMPGQLEEIYLAIEQNQQYMTQLMNALQEGIDGVQEQVDLLVTAIDNITARMDKQVTGILIQGVNSPVFGDFRTPLGVKSNILFNWYGYNDLNKEITFPSNDPNLSATVAPELPAALTPASTWTANVGYYGDDINDVTLGKVYVTLNPVGAQFDNLELSIENSAGEALPYTVTLTPSDYVLKHGISRAEGNDVNGFYEGEVKMALNDENVEQIEVAIEAELKQALKDVVKDPSKVTAKALVNAVFQQLQGKIPAYGLRYSWIGGITDDMDPGFSANAYSVLSQYDLAVATALPLSYNTFDGVHGSTPLRPIGHIQNLINRIKESGLLSFKLENISIDDIKIDWNKIDFSATETGELVIKLEDMIVATENHPKGEKMTLILTTDPTKYPAKPGEQVIAINGLNDITDGIVGGIENGVGGLTEQITAQIKSQLNSVIEKINNQISGKINDIISSIENKLEPYYGKINAAIDLYNGIVNKINDFVANPNAYMQVAAFYNMGGANYGIVSGKASDPTPFVGNGEAFKLYLSSYTAELIVPACKKYVAVTKVIGNDSRSLAAINEALGESFNSVLDGNKTEVAVKAAALKPGNVYEFTYQALDYRRFTSTKKFYIEVK